MYEFITIGGGEYFVDIFNGLAMLVKSGDYMNVLRISATLSFMIALFNAALLGSLYDSGKWFLTTFLISQTLLYPKASLHVTDKTNPGLIGAKIDNVPFVIAYTAATTSQIGYALTQQFEAVFSLPDDLQYTQNGMIFGTNLWKAIQQSKITNPYLASSVDSFSKNCIFFDVEYGIYSFKDLKNSADIWNFIKDKQVENRFFTYTDLEGATTYPTCKYGAEKLDADWKKQYQGSDLSDLLKDLAFSSSKPSLTKSVLDSATPLVTSYLFGVSESSERVLQQAMMINAINSATENYQAENQIQDYQNARATLQAESTYKTMGTQAGIWIPILKIVVEAIFYAAFPLVVLVALIPGMAGSVLRSYITTFFWLAAWGPIYAILHRISMGHGATYTLSLGEKLGVTLANQAALEQSMSSIAAMAGYMSMFVPMLAYGIARGGASAMSSMTTSFMSGVQSSVSSAAYEGSTGNLNFGNVGLNSRHAHSGISIMNNAGQTITYHKDGSTTIDNSGVESRPGFNLNISQMEQGVLSNSITKEESLGRSFSTQAQQSTALGFEKIISNHRNIESSKGFENNKSMEEKAALSKISQVTSDFAREHNITEEKSAEIFANIGAGKSLKGGAGGKISAVEQNLYREAQNYSNQHHLSKDFQTVKSAIESNRFNFTDSNGESINQHFTKASNLNKEAAVHFEAAKRYSEQYQYVKSHAAEIDRSYNQEFWRHIESKYDTYTAANMTNPSNPNKLDLNREIDQFMSHKLEELQKVQKPNLEAEYNRTSLKFAATNRKSQSVQNPYSFSKEVKAIDNSSLQTSVPKGYDNTKQIVENAQIDSSVEGGVKSKQEHGAAVNLIKKGAEEGMEILNSGLDLLKKLDDKL